uniref:Uncharacterized protein AlNc14C215G8997 n=1 Tax=Albugo laibachii Nc14 TaxID=890382 RepID=F0WRJ7_9STRA|nr:conserved hypothetical protein [Albugo laibachii Nc14]|eukprot:CCA23960.1 conserved hypothetical protein [Albugo laibachii Nc14]
MDFNCSKLLPQETLPNVLSALNVLFRPSKEQNTPQQRASADAHLRAFQLTPSAYLVAIELLTRYLSEQNDRTYSFNSDSAPAVFFAAQTIANKVRRQQPFPRELQWNFSLWLQHISKWMSAGFHPKANVPKMIQTQLILAFVACLVRLPPNEIQHKGTTDASVIQFALDQLSTPSFPPGTTAQVLSILIEEVNAIREHSLRERLQRDTETWVIPVLNQILPQIMQNAIQSSGSDRNHSHDVQTCVINALKSWIRYSQLDSSILAQNPLIQALLPSFLPQEHLFIVSLDAVGEMVYRYHDMHHDLSFLAWILPQILSLQPLFHDAMKEQDVDKALDIARLFTETADCLVALLLCVEEMQQCAILNLLLDCMEYAETEIVEFMIPFWIEFLEAMHSTDANVKQTLVSKYTSILLRLTNLCMVNLQFQEDFTRLPYDKQQDFKQYRHDLGDIMRDTTKLAGVNAVLEHCMKGLDIFTLPASQRKWEAIESRLFCIRSIARHVEASPEALANPLLPFLFDQFGNIADHPAIRYTACLTISRYASWLCKRPNALTPHIQFLTQSIYNSAQDASYKEWEVTSAAATAIRSIASDAYSFLGQDILRFYLELNHHQTIDVQNQVLILEGICIGLTSMYDPLTEANALAVIEMLKVIVTPTLERIFSLLQANSSGNSTFIMDEFLRLICLYDYLTFKKPKQAHDPLMWLTEKVWPLFHQSLTLFAGNDELVERICRCYKRIVRSADNQLARFLPHMIDNLIGFYRGVPKSSYLYVGNMILKHRQSLPPDEKIDQLLGGMLFSFAEMTARAFDSTQALQQYAEIVEEFFFLMERAIQTVPKLVISIHNLHPFTTTNDFPATLLARLIEYVAMALQFSHHNINKSALSFLEAILELYTTEKDAANVFGSLLIDPTSRITLEILAFAGATPCSRIKLIVHQLFRGLTIGSIASSRVDMDFGSIAGALLLIAKWNGGALCEWLEEFMRESLAGSPNALVFITPEEAADFQRNLFQSENERAFRRAVRHFGKLCASRYSVSLQDE